MASRRATFEELRCYKKRDNFINEIRALCPQMGSRHLATGIGRDENGDYVIKLHWYGYSLSEVQDVSSATIEKMDRDWFNEEMPALPAEITTDFRGEKIIVKLVHRKVGTARAQAD